MFYTIKSHEITLRNILLSSVFLAIMSLILQPVSFQQISAQNDFNTPMSMTNTTGSNMTFKAGSSNETTIQEKIGVLLPLTGPLASEGLSEKVALDIATNLINENLSKTNSKIRISLIAEDTQTDPAVSLEKTKGPSRLKV